MSPRSTQGRRAYDTFKANLPVFLLVVSTLTALGIVVNPLRALEKRVTTVEQTMKDVGRWARASAIDLCLSRPDSVLARMDLDCRSLLNR